MVSSMEVSRVRQLLDEHWTATLGVAPSVWRDTEVVVASHPEPSHSDHVYLIRRGQSCIVVVPEALVGSTTIACAQWPSPAVFDRSFVRSLYGDAVSSIHGPFWLGYATADTFRAVAGSEVRPLGTQDRPALVELRSLVTEDEWVDAGMEMDTRQEFGLMVDGRLAAAGTLNPFRGAPANVGVLTHPSHRRRGHGSALLSALTSLALAETNIAQSRVLEDNHAALGIARRLGYVEDGRTLEVVLRARAADLAD